MKSITGSGTGTFAEEVLKEKQEPISLQQVKEVATKWLYIEDETLIDVCLAVVVANRLECDPLWLWIVSASGNCKTEILRAMSRADDTHFVSTLTGQTLVSGFRKNGKDPSLLPRLDGKMLLIKDGTSILSLPNDERRKIFSQLRESYDGFFDASFGSEAGSTSYRARFGLLGACTPEIDRVSGVNQVLGERFLYYRPIMTNRKGAVEKARSNKGKEDGMRQELSETFCRFLDGFEDYDITTPPELEQKIEALAMLISWLRSNVSRNGYTREIAYIPEPEVGTRLVKQLLSLAQGLSLIRGKRDIGDDEYMVLRKVARDTLTNKKRLVFEALFMNQTAFKTTQEFGDMTNLPTETVKAVLEDYRVLGVCDRQGTNEFEWRLKDAISELVFKADL